MSIELPAAGATVEVVVRGIIGSRSGLDWLHLRCVDGDRTRNAGIPVSALVSVTEVVVEPTANGAVVRDGEGRLWVRIAASASDVIPWRRVDLDSDIVWEDWASLLDPISVCYDPARDES